MSKVLLFFCSIVILLAVGDGQVSSTTYGDQTTYFWPSSVTEITTEANPPSSSNYTAMIFIQEMTRYISYEDRSNFFGLVRKIVAAIPHTLQFGYVQYGNSIYEFLQLTDYDTFLENLDDCEAIFNISSNPNGSLVYIAPAFDQILSAVYGNPKGRFAVLLSGEQDRIKDPNAGNTASKKIADAQIDFYVVDYSTGIIPFGLWNVSTGGLPNHIINGTGQTADQLFSFFQNTLVDDINNG